MDIKIGDRVRFLNSVGGGIVCRFRGKDQVLVEDEDGFEVPALIRELVVIETNGAQVRNRPRPKEERTVEKPVPPPEVKEEQVVETPEGERLDLYLAYLPLEPKAMLQSGYEAYFINNSNYYLFFNYMNRQHSSWFSRYNGLIEPNTKIFMEEFGKEELNNMERMCVQLIAFKKDKPYSLKNAISVELRIDTVKFYKAHCFMENDFFEEEALLFPVVRSDVPERELLVSAIDIQEAMQQKAYVDLPPSKPAVKKKAAPSIPEIDLHINQLLDDTNGLSPADMLNYQLEKFHEALALYAGQKGQKIIFIHGKGDGTLRSAIEKELKTRYKSYDYQDASFREYGFGATMVTIR
ncbi:MAG: DUF2027 domain-containing protein [Tannerellaceae bacterium]|jgi:hypothetical protein|nr:DUF2027 domain-containing protein [Tannerellaceae bacterium]